MRRPRKITFISRRGQFMGVRIQHIDNQALYVNLIKSFLHGSIINEFSRVGKVPGITGRPAGHLFVRNDPDPAFIRDYIGPYEKLTAFPVDHPVGRCPSNAFRSYYLFQVRCDLIKLAGRTIRGMGTIGNNPEAVSPGYHSTRATLVFIIVKGQVRIDTTDIQGLLAAGAQYQ
jgi:hypothetical protein